MGLDGLLDLPGAESVARHVDDVVGSTQNEDVTVLVAGGVVEGGVDPLAGHAREISLHEAVVVAPDGLQAAGWQRWCHAEHALFVGGHLLEGGFVDEPHIVAIDREARAAELGLGDIDAMLGRQDGPAGLGLPVVVDDLHTAKCIRDPTRRRLIEGLTGQEEAAQLAGVVSRHEARVLLLEHACGGGRREHGGHAMLFYNRPPDGGVGPNGQALVDHRGRAIDERGIDNVGVAHHPADVGGGEHGFAGLAVIDVPHGGGQGHRIATGVTLHALGLSGGARGVEDVTGVGGQHGLTGHGSPRMLLPKRAVFHIAFGHQIERRQSTVDEQDLGGGSLGEPAGLIHQVLVRHLLATAHAGI